MITKKVFINRLRAFTEILILVAIDIVSLLVIFHLAVFLRTDVLPLVYKGFPLEMPFRRFINIWWLYCVWLFFFYREGLYTKRFSFWEEIRTLWQTSFFSTVGIFTLVSLGKLSDEISRTLVILMGWLAVLILPLTRIISKKILRRLGFFKRKVLILGAGETGKLILRALKKEPNLGYKVVGFLDDDTEKVGKYLDGIKIHKGVDNIFRYIPRCNIRDIFIAMPGAKKERVEELINNLQHKVERILFVPDLFGLAVLGTSMQHFFQEQAFALEIKNNLEKPLNIFIKRCFDFFVSGLLILLLFIPMVIIAILIKLDSKGPAIFLQDRIGKKGKNFKCYKFRTMYCDAKERLQEILTNEPAKREEWENYWKLKDDPRITRVGRFLRQTSLDELPQIFNVLKNQMSLVGPRPVTQNEIDKYYKEKAVLYFSVPSGITGLWQVSGRSNESYDYRIALDLWYVRNWNLWLDLVILFKTIRVVLKREGAY